MASVSNTGMYNFPFSEKNRRSFPRIPHTCLKIEYYVVAQFSKKNDLSKLSVCLNRAFLTRI
jgi:hypothetical protein